MSLSPAVTDRPTSAATVDTRRLTIATGAAALANLAIFAIGSLADATWSAGQPYPIGWAMVLVATIVPMVLAGLATSLIARRQPKVLTWFAWAGLAFAVLGAPMGYVMGGDVPTGIALGAMHVATGLAWFWAIKPHADR